MFERQGVPGDWESLVTTALEYANDAIVLVECVPDGTYLLRYVNHTFESQTGYAREEALGQPLSLLYGPKTDRAVSAELVRALMSNRAVVADLLKYRKDGTSFWAEVSARPIAGPNGRPDYWIVVQRDVTERVHAKAELELLTAAMDHANDGIAIFRAELDRSWHFRHVNDMFLRMTGYEIGEVIGQTSDILFGERTDTKLMTEYRTVLFGGRSVRGDFAFYRKDGSHFWADINAQVLRDEEGTTHSVVVYRDVTEQHLQGERLSFEATHDELTGLANRRSFERTLDSALREARQRDVSHALAFFDLDGFKPINDAHGHEAGDRLLCELAKAVSAKLRHGDVFARIGGDEFAILLFGCLPEQGKKIAEDVLAAIRGLTVTWGNHALGAGASIGIAAVDADAGSIAGVMRRADAACYAAKAAGRNCIVIAG